MELTDKQMNEVSGGISWGVLGGIAAAIIYVVGVLNGYTNPSRCNN